MDAERHAPAVIGERGPDRARRADLGPVVEVVDVVVVEIDGALDQTEAEQSLAEVEIGLRLVHGRGDVVEAQKRGRRAHRDAGSNSRSWKSKLKSTAGEVGAILT